MWNKYGEGFEPILVIFILDGTKNWTILESLQLLHMMHAESDIKMFSSLSHSRVRISPPLNILCTTSDKPSYTENTKHIHHDVQLLHTIPSKCSINADYEHMYRVVQKWHNIFVRLDVTRC